MEEYDYVPPASLPSSSDSVVIQNSPTNSGSVPTVVNLTVAGSLGFSVTVTGTAVFTGGTLTGGTLTGSANFDSGSYINGGNLVGNATRYCKVGTIKVSATRWDDHDPTAIEFTVFNSGPEITPEARKKLFVKYGKGAGGQRGFGLYFSRLACEAHGGSIECREATGGVCFAFRLPGRR
jgi:hypothetical protein